MVPPLYSSAAFSSGDKQSSVGKRSKPDFFALLRNLSFFFALRRISLSHYFSKTPLIMPFRTRPCSNKKMSQIKGYESLFPHISSRVFIQASLLPQCGILMKISEGYKISYGQSLLLGSYVAKKILVSDLHGVENLGPKLHPRGRMFWTMLFIILKKCISRSI